MKNEKQKTEKQRVKEKSKKKQQQQNKYGMIVVGAIFNSPEIVDYC